MSYTRAPPSPCNPVPAALSLLSSLLPTAPPWTPRACVETSVQAPRAGGFWEVVWSRTCAPGAGAARPGGALTPASCLLPWFGGSRQCSREAAEVIVQVGQCPPEELRAVLPGGRKPGRRPGSSRRSSGAPRAPQGPVFGLCALSAVTAVHVGLTVSQEQLLREVAATLGP